MLYLEPANRGEENAGVTLRVKLRAYLYPGKRLVVIALNILHLDDRSLYCSRVDLVVVRKNGSVHGQMVKSVAIPMVGRKHGLDVARVKPLLYLSSPFCKGCRGDVGKGLGARGEGPGARGGDPTVIFN